MNAVTEVMDELRKALAEVDDIRASLRRKVRHCDELTEERDQMQRERDEARAALAKCPDCAMWAERSARWHDDMQRAERERDEARREADRFRHGCTVEGDFVCPNEYAVGELTAERNFLRALKKNHEEDFTRVCKERDEARAEVERLRSVLSATSQELADIAATPAEERALALEMELAVARAERDEARAEVERQRELKDYLRTWLSSEELEGLRVKAAEHPLLWEEIHHLKAEVERLSRLLKMAEDEAVAADNHGRREARRADAAEADAERLGAERDEARAEVGRLRWMLPVHPSSLTDACTDAYRRGAEAMREACARWFREHDESFELTVDACHDVIADMPIPEDK